MENAIRSSYDLYINGKWVPASDGSTFKAFNPSNGEQLSVCAEATKEDVDAAVRAAEAAFPAWKKVSPIDRQNILLKIADVIDQNADKLALIESLDNGKPIRETRNIDIPYSADHFRYFAAVLRDEEGRVSSLDENMMSIVIHEPIGVVGQVIPWNFPFLMGAWKLAPALAAGCTIVLKPSSSTSLSLLELMHLLEGVLPAGVVNIITGKGSRSGQYLLDHPDIQKLAFTGSTEIGRDVYKAAQEKLIPATLELGGKSANIFFEDCKWDMAMEGAEFGILFNQGQVCSAGSRIFVQRSIYDKFVNELAERFNRVKVGLPWLKETQMGAQVDERQLEKILSYIELGKKKVPAWYAAVKRSPPTASKKVTSSVRPSSPTSRMTCASPRKKSSGRSSSSSPSIRKKKSSIWRTTAFTVSAAPYGPATSTVLCA